jgi:hypothetical protein
MRMARTQRRPRLATALSAMVLALAAVTARAAAADASCKPVEDALMKVFHTPTHLTSTRTGAAYGATPHTGELIYMPDAIYVKMKGQWKRSTMKPDDMLAQEKENMESAKSFSCRYLREESVDGEPASVYGSHTVTDVATSDVTIWISVRTGLPLRQEVDLDIGGKLGKSHTSSRYDYRDVHAPAGVQ